MSERVGSRGRPIKCQPACSQGASGPNYMAEAEAIVGGGKPLESFTREEHALVLQMAVAACKADGRWPDKLSKPTPDKMCANGHQFRTGKSCPDCERERERERKRKSDKKRYRARIAA